MSSGVHPQPCTNPLLSRGVAEPFRDKEASSISPSASQICVSLKPQLSPNRELLSFYLR